MKTKIDFIKDGLKQIKAYCDLPAECCEVTVKQEHCCEVSRGEIQYLWDELSYLYRYISNLDEQLYKQANDGHLPKIRGGETRGL